ncbi:MAG: DUF2807 domain-containing protein [Bacteroidetes bacterium]|nr:DUF2807 domain-containing protein [Bacteroidota bacterium]
MLKRTGEKTSVIRELPPFTKIYLKDNVNVFITQGNLQEVKVEGGENLIPLVKTEVINGELHIDNDNKCNWSRSYKKGTLTVYVTIPSLRYISHHGSGKISSNGIISCDTLDILTNESGDVELWLNAHVVFNHLGTTSDVTLHGTSSLMGIYHTGEGYLHCEDLETDFTWSYSKASGNEYLNAKQSLALTIDWEGDVYYSGNPAASVKGTGNGKLIRLN